MSENEVVIHIRGGVVHVTEKPSGVAVRIRDFDAAEEGMEQPLEMVYPGEKSLSQAEDEEINDLASRIIQEINTEGDW